jgi:hypothetical protein
MDPSDRLARYGARLLLEMLDERFGVRFDISEGVGDAFIATDGSHRIGVHVAPLWEREVATPWEGRLRGMEQRLNLADAEGAYLLWVPPGAGVPAEEPDASDFVERVESVAASLPPDARAEVKFPVKVKLAKTRAEGGYASVVGGLSRWWTRITENVDGTYYVDSSDVHRITRDGAGRERLWSDIGQLSLSMEVGQGTKFEVDEAWTLQRLPESETEAGFALAAAPPSADITEGFVVRRMARRRLAAATETLGALDVELRVVGLIGIYEYAELEGAGATVKALDPSLYNRLEVVCVLVDGEVRPTFLPRALPWQA